MKIEGTQSPDVQVESAGAQGADPAEAGGSGIDAVLFDDLDSDGEPYVGKSTANADEPAAEGEAAEGEVDPAESSEIDAEKVENSEEKEEDPKKPDEKAAAKPKVLKVRVGDKDVEIPTDAKVDVTVGGKKESVSVQELLNEYAGKTDWSRKYTDLDRERKTFQAERQDLTSSINRLYELAVKEGDPQSAIEFLAEAIGGDPQQVWETLEAQIRSTFEEYVKLSPEERKARELEEKEARLRKREERSKASARDRQTRETFGKRVQAVREQLGITEAEFVKLYNELKDSGEVAPEHLTPEFVGNYHREMVSRQQLGKMLTELNPELPAKIDAVSELRKVWLQNPDFTIDDMREIAVKAYGAKKKPEPTGGGLKKKLVGKQAAMPAKPASEKNAPLTFDDLD